MWWSLFCVSAFATDLSFALETGEGIQEQWTKDHKEALTREFGPVLGKGKRRVLYNVTIMPSVFDPIDDGFQTQVSVCRSWTKKGERDRDCVDDLLMIPSERKGPVLIGGKIKGRSDNFELKLLASYAGAPPGSGMPSEVPEEPVVEEVVDAVAEPEVPAEPEKDEMTSALENIASDIVSGLPTDGPKKNDDEAKDED